MTVLQELASGSSYYYYSVRSIIRQISQDKENRRTVVLVNDSHPRTTQQPMQSMHLAVALRVTTQVCKYSKLHYRLSGHLVKIGNAAFNGSFTNYDYGSTYSGDIADRPLSV